MQRAAGFLDEDVGHSLLKARAEVAACLPAQPAMRGNLRIARPKQRGLQPRKGQVTPRPVKQRARESEGARVARGSFGLDRRPTGLRQTEQLCRLVEGLARRVVDRAAKAGELRLPLDHKELTVPAGDQKHQVGKLEPVRQPRRQRMPGEMIDPDERQVACGGQPLGAHHPRHDAANQPGSGGCSDPVQRIETQPRFLHRLFHAEIEPFGMGARSDFGYDATKGRMQVRLTGDDRGQYFGTPIVQAHDGGGGIVAARFDAEEGEGRGHGSRLHGLPFAGNTGEEFAQSRQPMPHADASRPVLLLTRPRAASERFAQQFRARFGSDWPVIISPLLEIEPLDAEIPQTQALIFTSEHAIAPVVAAGPAAGRRAYCVGGRTAQVARAAGFEVVRGAGGAAELLGVITQHHRGETLLHARGSEIAQPVAEKLNSAGIETKEAIVYAQIPHVPSIELRDALAGTVPVIAAVFSPNSGRQLLPLLIEAHAPLRLATISEAAARTLAPVRAERQQIAASPDAEGMLAAMTHLL